MILWCHHPIWLRLPGYTTSCMDIEFDTNGRNILTIGKQIDYLSMEITLLFTYDITLTNTAKIDFFLEEAGRSDVRTTTMPPMTKASLKLAMLKDTPLCCVVAYTHTISMVS